MFQNNQVETLPEACLKTSSTSSTWTPRDGGFTLRVTDLEGTVLTGPDNTVTAAVDMVNADNQRFPYWTGEEPYRSLKSAKIAVTSAITWDARKKRLGIARAVGLLRAPQV